MSEKEPPNHGDDAPETSEQTAEEAPADDSALEQEFFAERSPEELADAVDDDRDEVDEDLVDANAMQVLVCWLFLL